MIRKILIIFLLVLGSISVFGKNERNNFLSYQGKINLQVINVEKSQDEIIRYLENNKGYFTRRDSGFLQAKIVPATLLEFMDFLKKQGVMVSQEIQSNNYQQQLQELEITIKTEDESLSSILGLFEQAGLYQALSIERKIQGMIRKIESAKGRYRYLMEHIRYAYVDITFKSFSGGVQKELNSPFQWINELNIENLFNHH